MARYQGHRNQYDTKDEDDLMKSQQTGIDLSIENIWKSSKKSFLKGQIETETQNTSNLRNSLARAINPTNMRGMRNGKTGIIAATKWGSKAHYATWFRDHVELHTVGYGRYPITFFLSKGRKSRSYLVNDNELDIIMDYLELNTPYIESSHSYF